MFATCAAYHVDEPRAVRMLSRISSSAIARRRTMPRACILSIVGNMRAAMSSAIAICAAAPLARASAGRRLPTFVPDAFARSSPILVRALIYSLSCLTTAAQSESCIRLSRSMAVSRGVFVIIQTPLALQYIRDFLCIPCGRAASRLNVEPVWSKYGNCRRTGSFPLPA